MIKMRICGGLYRGKKINGIEWTGTRPITDRIKENVFNLLGQHCHGSVLDLFAGTGSIGLEALSRGAEFCNFNELNKEPQKVLKSNVEMFDVKYEVTSLDAYDQLHLLNHTFDFIFLDPPFPIDRNEELLDKIFKMKLLNESGKIILRIDSKKNIKDSIPFKITKEKVYGASRVYILEGN